MKKSLVPFVPALLSMAASADSNVPSWSGPDRPVDVVTKNHYAEGFTPNGDTARFTDLIMIEIYPGSGAPPDETASYPIGESRKLYHQGAQVGTVTIRKTVPLQCDSNTALVSSKTVFDTDMMALASNATGIATHAPSVRKLSDAEEREVRALVIREFAKYGVAGMSTSDLKFEKTLLTTVNKDGAPIMIGSFSYKKEVEYDLSMVLALEKTGAVPQLSKFHVMKDLEDGTDYQGFRFVDQLDMDGDGVDELVFEVTGYEDEAFDVYKREDGTWVKVWEGGGGGC